MKISRNWLQTYFEKPILAADELAELFTFHSFEIESIERVDGDDVLDVKVLPDRAHYALCHRGIALEVSVLTKEPFKSGRVPPGPKDFLDKKAEIKIEAPSFCRRYMARYGEIPNVAPSNPHACAMLEAIGQRPINAVVDATNMVMFDIGQPLHIFDADQVKGTIVIRAARAGEKILLLDSSAGAGREVELLESDHVIADDLGPIAIAGVKGGKRSGVTEKTRRIIVESANFDPSAVRRTATRLDLRSESSKRYENEITPELTALGMDNVCALVAYNISQSAFGPVVDVYPRKVSRNMITIEPAYIDERLGISVPADEAKDILLRMGIEIDEKGKTWTLTVPFERLDLTIREDIVEEVGRIYGYEHVQGILPPKTGSAVPVLPEFYVAEKIKNVLADDGYSEVNLYTLVASGEIETAYPLARDKSFARKNLTDGIMACLEKNVQNAELLGLETIKLFEIGHVFRDGSEFTMLGLGAAQIKKKKGVNASSLIVEAVSALEKALNTSIPVPAMQESAKTAAVIEINLSELIKTLAIPPNASYADLGFGPASKNMYKTYSPYPFIVRDIAVLVPTGTTAESVWDLIQKGIEAAGAAPLVARHALFDRFEKDGKISYAFHIIFQSMDRTLTDAEANGFMQHIYEGVKKAGWDVR